MLTDLTLTSLYRLNAAGHDSPEEQLIKTTNQNLRSPIWTQLFVKEFKRKGFNDTPIYTVYHRSRLDAERPSKEIVDS